MGRPSLVRWLLKSVTAELVRIGARLSTLVPSLFFLRESHVSNMAFSVLLSSAVMASIFLTTVPFTTLQPLLMVLVVDSCQTRSFSQLESSQRSTLPRITPNDLLSLAVVMILELIALAALIDQVVLSASSVR